MENRNPDGTWKKGVQPRGAGKPKGAVSEKTRIWNEIGEWFSNEGLEAYQEELINMKAENPAEFMKRYETMMEYFKPKLSRANVDHTTKGDKIAGSPIIAHNPKGDKPNEL